MQSEETDANRGKSTRVRKPNPKHAEYFAELQSKSMKCQVQESSKGLDLKLKELTLDIEEFEDPKEVLRKFEVLENDWQKYKEIYEEYAKSLIETQDLQRVAKQCQNFTRRVEDVRKLVADYTKSLKQGSVSNSGKDDGSYFSSVSKKTVNTQRSSRCSSKRTSNSQHSSQSSSKARAASNAAKLAKLKLEQAKRDAEIAKKQVEIEQEIKLQKLQNEVEYNSMKAELLEEEQAEIMSILSSVRSGQSVQDSGSKLDPDANSFHPRESSESTERKSVISGEERSTSREVISTMVEAMKVNAETTKTLKCVLQRQNVPKPDPIKFSGNPAEFPIFETRIQEWLSEKEFTEREKILYLLSFVEGEAKELIRHCEIGKNGFIEAIKILKEEYGHPVRVVRSSLRNIIEGPRIEKGDKSAMIQLRNDLRSCIKVLSDNEDFAHELNASCNLEKIIERLPIVIQFDWAKRVPKISAKVVKGPNMTHILDLIQEQVDIMSHPVFGAIMTSKKNGGNSYKKTQPEVRKNDAPPRQVSTLNTDVDVNKASVPSKCPCCNGTHVLSKCQKFMQASIRDRWLLVKEHKLCFRCLAKGHGKAECKSTAGTCDVCSEDTHHKLLHRELKHRDSRRNGGMKDTRHAQEGSPHQGDVETPFANQPQEEKRVADIRTTITDPKKRTILLHVVPVKVTSEKGNSVSTYGLLDNASRGTIIDKSLAKQLKLTGHKESVVITTVTGKEECNCEVVSLSLQAVDPKVSDTILNVHDVLVRDLNINERILPHDIDNLSYPHLADICVPDVDVKKVSMIIGEDADDAHIIQDIRVSKNPKCKLYASKTVLGWTVAGTLTSGNAHDAQKEVSVNFISRDSTLSEQVEQFWKIDNSGTEGIYPKSLEDVRAENVLQETTKKVDGHYEVGMLWKEDNPQLPNNRVVAESRLQTLRRKFQRNPEFEAMYRKTIQEYVTQGFARKLNNEETARVTDKTWYLPHHGVCNPNKPGKVRVVFDAAAQYRGTSLNKNLMQGPDYTNSLLGVLMRFRSDNIALVADIEGMFHQVKVPREDQESLRFLWWGERDSAETPDEYAMTVHIFGATDSPCCANYALQRTAQDELENFDKETTRSVKRNFYVDDMLKSLRSVDQAIGFAKEMVSLLDKGGFRLRKFMSNNREVLQAIPPEERASSLDINLDRLPVERALGVIWNVEEDIFCFKVKSLQVSDTMRGILSGVASFYDPQGFAAPVILQGKKILQDCWRQKLTWDEPLKGEILEKWKKWKDMLPLMLKVEIPRCFFSRQAHTGCSIQLHHFCDASEAGYGTASYLRISYPDGTINCTFIIGKSRCSPIQAPTIPRLELQSAVLATRVDKVIQEELDLPLKDTVFWTDSMITLYCINNNSKRFQTFVANRLQEIQASSEPKQWRHCPGKENPADDSSRGLDADEYLKSRRWLNGPDFLWKEECEWPQQKVKEIPPEQLEVKKEKATYTTDTTRRPSLFKLMEMHSSWYKLQRSVAWLQKFTLWLKNRKKLDVKKVTLEDLKKAKQRIILLVQAESYPEEMKDLTPTSKKRDNEVGPIKPPHVKASSALVKLKPVMDGEGLLRVSGRISQAPISYMMMLNIN